VETRVEVAVPVPVKEAELVCRELVSLKSYDNCKPAKLDGVNLRER